MLRANQFICRTNAGRLVTLSESDDHILELKIDGKVVARFSQTGVTIENILKEVKAIGAEN